MVKKNEVRRLFETGAVKGYLPSDMSALEIRINNMGTTLERYLLTQLKRKQAGLYQFLILMLCMKV